MPGLDTLYTFPVYQTRETYKHLTGMEAPPWDPSKPIKSWEDRQAPSSDEDGYVQYQVLALGPDKKSPAVGTHGRPYLRTMRILRSDAVRVNIPPKDFSHQTNRPDPGSLSPMASVEVPVPCRDLLPDEELFVAWGGRAEVRKKTEAPPPSQGGATTPATDPETKQLLLEVLSKLDILLATSRQ